MGGLPMTGSTTLGTARPPKGVIGWLTEESLLVIGGGSDAKWEKFVIMHEAQGHVYGGPQQLDGGGGKRVCAREGWKRYLGGP